MGIAYLFWVAFVEDSSDVAHVEMLSNSLHPCNSDVSSTNPAIIAPITNALSSKVMTAVIESPQLTLETREKCDFVVRGIPTSFLLLCDDVSVIKGASGVGMPTGLGPRTQCLFIAKVY